MSWKLIPKTYTGQDAGGSYVENGYITVDIGGST